MYLLLICVSVFYSDFIAIDIRLHFLDATGNSKHSFSLSFRMNGWSAFITVGFSFANNSAQRCIFGIHFSSSHVYEKQVLDFFKNQSSVYKYKIP